MTLSHGDLAGVTNRNVLRGFVRPAARVHIPNVVNHDIYGSMGMTAEDHICLVLLATMKGGIVPYLVAEAKPLLAGSFYPPRCAVMWIKLLDDEVDPGGNGRHKHMFGYPFVELVTMDG